jgi:hypothetical protein
MAFEDLDFEDDVEGKGDEALPEEASNRTFILIAGAIGVVAILSLVCIVVVYLSLSRSRTAQVEQQATLDAQNTEVAGIIAETSTSAAMDAIRAAYTPTPTQTSVQPPTFTPTATTPVVAESPTPATPSPIGPTLDPLLATATQMQATINAQLALATLTAKPSATAIGQYGFAEEVGLPAMLGLAALLIVVIFLARRLRTT